MTSATMRASAALALGAALAGCGTFVDPTDPDFTPGTVVLPGDGNEIVALPSCATVSFSNVRFGSLTIDPERDERTTGEGEAYAIELRSFEYEIVWDGASATDILVKSAAAYPTPLDSSLYATLAGAEANCDESRGDGGDRTFYCGDVEDALVPQPLGARCSGGYQRANATDYLPQACVDSGVGWDRAETRLDGLRTFAKRPLIAEHPYDVTLGAWCEDESGAARFTSVTQRLVTPSYDER